MFAYCENDPVNRSDPSGEIHILVGALIGGVIGGGLELAKQLVCGTNFADVNWDSVVIETLSGTAKGAAMSVGIPSKVMMSTIDAITTVAHSINERDSIAETVGKVGISFLSSNKKSIVNKILKSKINLGSIGKTLGKLTYQGKHLKYDTVRNIKSNGFGRAAARTLNELLHNYLYK
mgnify:CR=1 FL=1